MPTMKHSGGSIKPGVDPLAVESKIWCVSMEQWKNYRTQYYLPGLWLIGLWLTSLWWGFLEGKKAEDVFERHDEAATIFRPQSSFLKGRVME